MKKDIFNGNISPIFRGTVIFSLILATVVFVGCGIFFLLTALFYENTEEAAKIFLYCFSAFSLIAGIAYPIYNAIVKVKRKKLAPEIIRLADELIK